MRKHFVTYEIALKLKELGFDEPCFGYYRPMKEWMMRGTKFNPERHFHGCNWANPDNSMYFMYVSNSFGDRDSVIKNSEFTKATENIAVPLWQQIMKWFLKRKILIEVFPIDDWEHWSYRITGEDCMSSFYIMYQHNEDLLIKDKPYEQAILKAIELIKKSEI